MNLTEIRQTLASAQISLTKSLGQNFLHDAHQLERIIRAAELDGSDRVLEIGPGLGALTQFLVEMAPEILAIEKDKRLYDLLSKRFANRPQLSLVHADALACLRDLGRDWFNWKVISNLPYSVASPILVELGLGAQAPARMVVTLQLEVAERIAATAGQRDYGILSLLLQLQYEPKVLFRIPPGCFFPAPDVDSACLRLVRKDTVPLRPDQFPVFKRIVKRSFSQRRKMMLKLLRAEWPADKLGEVFRDLGISPQARAETVTLEQFVQLTRVLPGL